MPEGRREPDTGMPIAAIVSAALLALGGLAFGLILGGGGESEPVTIVETVTVERTETVRRTRTVTVPEAGDALAEGDTSASTTPDDSDEDCSADYLGTCVPTDDRGIGCADISATNFDSIGADPYDLDPDGDGIACET